jgi:hypothetical protein
MTSPHAQLEEVDGPTTTAALDDALDGGTGRGIPTSGESQWQELNGNYQQRFGISPEEATPPPQRS